MGVFLLWLAIYGGADWITSLHNYRIPLRTRFDSAIPSMPAAAIVYLSLFPMLWLSPFVLRTAGQLRVFALALATVILISGIGFVLVPAEPIDIGSVETDLQGRVFQFADWINLKYNSFPSLHVAMAFLCAASFSCSKSAAIGIFFWLWASMIALSTLLTRQHHIGDVIAGGLLGAMVALRRPLHRYEPALIKSRG
jgi:membrane-associated phospholipid phosphatase